MIPWLLSSDHSTEETLPSSPCAQYHAGECDSHSPVSDEYSGCKRKGRDTQSYAHAFNISSQTYFPRFYICTRGAFKISCWISSSRPLDATAKHHHSWGTPAPSPSNRMPNILSAAGPQSLSPTSHRFLPSPPIILNLSLVPSANSAHPTQNNQGIPVSSNSSWNCASKTKLLQETFHWASPEQRINSGRAANAGWRRLGACQFEKLSEQHLKHFIYTMCTHTRLLGAF